LIWRILKEGGERTRWSEGVRSGKKKLKMKWRKCRA